MDISFTVNDNEYSLSVAPDLPLCDFIREELGLYGTKVGCREGVCGSCNVLLDGVPVRSCLMLAVQTEGHRITTVEGLASGGMLHAVQRAFIEAGALQCGFCTPGMLITAVAFLRDHPGPSRAEIADALAGNLCRCTGYIKIIDAVEASAATQAAGV